MAEVLKKNNMERKSKSGPFKMKGNPIKNLLSEVTVSGGKGGKSLAQREYEKKIERDASMEYDKERPSRGTGSVGGYSKLTEKQKNIYRAKAQKRDSATKMKKSPAKAGQTAGQIIRRERHMV